MYKNSVRILRFLSVIRENSLKYVHALQHGFKDYNVSKEYLHKDVITYAV